MSNRTNYRRSEERRTENGPRRESRNPGKGCNSTHVARARSAWKRLLTRAWRRTLQAEKRIRRRERKLSWQVEIDE